MLRRLLTCAFVALFAVAPAALELCGGACAAAETGQPFGVAADGTAHHSCHSLPATAPRTMSAAPHSCGHIDRAPDGVDCALHRLAGPAVVVLELDVQLAVGLAANVGDFSIYRPPPLARLTQLRV